MTTPLQIRPRDVGYDRRTMERLLAAMTLTEIQAELDYLERQWGALKGYEHEHPVAAATLRDLESWQMAQIREAIATRSRQ